VKSVEEELKKALDRASWVTPVPYGAEQFARASQEGRGAAGEIFLTEKELAARHQRSVKTLRNARVNGGFIRFVRYRLSDVLAYEAANSVGSTSGQ
jgi:hypothetical protein